MAAASSFDPDPLPEDLRAIVSDLAAGETSARELVGDLNDEQLNWRPDGGAAWSIAQCLDHLAKTNVIYAVSIRSAVLATPTAMPRRNPIRPGWFGRFFIQSMDAPARRKFSAPKKIKPVSSINGAEALAAFVESHEDMRSLIAESAEVDLNRIRFKNPFAGFIRFTAGTGLLIVAAHDRRHLWQAKQVRSGLASHSAK